MFVFLFLDYWFIIPAAIAKISNSVAELVIPIGVLSIEAKEEVEIKEKFFNII